MRRFLVRGLKKVEPEWNLAATCHNLLKMFRHGKEAALSVLHRQHTIGELAGIAVKPALT